MTWARLLRAELRKLTTTRMPLAFFAVLVVISGLNATVVIAGTDFDGSKDFISTAQDQRSLMAFAANATMGGALFGAMAVAREFAHRTVIPTFLSSPRRHRAVSAQFVAVTIGAGVLSFLGSALTVGAVALALPATDYGFLVSASGVAQVLAAATFAGAMGGLLGAGIGAIVRNTGGAVASTFFVLMIAPPLLVQMANEANSWVPSTLANVLSGVEAEVAASDQVSIGAAIVAFLAWAVVPAVIGLFVVERRDIA
jgi:ABC-2 type transport system permease protein